VILISVFDGGTGAAPLTSQHTGIPWELGLQEHNKPNLNDLRSRR
jgi:glutamate synthase domain-containing protein 2